VAPTTGRSFTVQPGAEYDVPDQLGASLCEQKWFEPVELPDAKPDRAKATRKETSR
jgi:hypothetical protein